LARLIRTEKEVEGRFEEVWLVVEEDPLEQWPEGPLAVVGRAAPRQDGALRVRGEARYTADIKLPGMLHAAVLRSPHAHARVRRIDLAPALALPGVRAAIGPGEAHGLEEEAGWAGAPVAAVAADSFAQARAAVEAVDVEWEELEVVLDPEEAVRRGLVTGDERRSERGDVDRAFAGADVVVEAIYRTQTVLHNSLETHQATCEWQGDTLHVYISTQYIWGIRQEVAQTLGLPEDKVRVIPNAVGPPFAADGEAAAGDYVLAVSTLEPRKNLPRLVDAFQRAHLNGCRLLVAGARDPATPPEHSRLIASKIPGARLVELDAAHLSNIEARDRFTASVLEFLS